MVPRYGDIVPADATETSVALVVGVLGAMFAAVVVANVTSCVNGVELSNKSIAHQSNCVKRFTQSHPCPSKESLDKYYRELENHEWTVDYSKFREECLSATLNDEVVMWKAHDVVLRSSTFAYCDDMGFLRAVMLHLAPQTYRRGDWIPSSCARGDPTQARAVEGLFLIQKGKVELSETAEPFAPVSLLGRGPSHKGRRSARRG
jgi:hypothetical protein